MKYVQNAELNLAALLESHHAKKKARIALLLSGYKQPVKRNGRYQPSHIKELEEFVAKFYA